MSNTFDLPIFTISSAAKLLGISVHTLRMYEREGLIIPFKKESNQRLYSEKDIERVKCIRKAINEDKISIQGIKRILSLIPCWAVISCSLNDRENCSAYNGHSEACWMLNHKNNVCSDKECRDCEVYNEYGNCKEIKTKLKELF